MLTMTEVTARAEVATADLHLFIQQSWILPIEEEGRYFFDDADLERVKASFVLTMPYVGATLLDEFLSEHYEKTREMGAYEVWQIKEPGD